MSGRPVRLLIAAALLLALGATGTGCRKADAPEQRPAALTSTTSPSPTATAAPTEPDSGSALTASDAAAIEKELSAIEKELGALSLPNDDFSSAEKALY